MAEILETQEQFPVKAGIQSFCPLSLWERARVRAVESPAAIPTCFIAGPAPRAAYFLVATRK